MGEKLVVDMPRSTDAWTSGDAYEPYVGRWSRAVAREFLAWLDVPHGGKWLDVGCGTGALSGVILEEASPTEVVGIDPSAEYVAFASGRVTDSRARFAVGDGRALPFPSAALDAVVAGLVLNFVSDPTASVTRWRAWPGPAPRWEPTCGTTRAEWS